MPWTVCVYFISGSVRFNIDIILYNLINKYKRNIISSGSFILCREQMTSLRSTLYKVKLGIHLSWYTLSRAALKFGHHWYGQHFIPPTICCWPTNYRTINNQWILELWSISLKPQSHQGPVWRRSTAVETTTLNRRQLCANLSVPFLCRSQPRSTAV